MDAPETALFTTICRVNIHPTPVIPKILISQATWQLAEHIRTCNHIEPTPPTVQTVSLHAVQHHTVRLYNYQRTVRCHFLS